MVDNLLPDHVGLPHVLDLAVHLVQLMTWMGRGGHTEIVLGLISTHYDENTLRVGRKVLKLTQRKMEALRFHFFRNLINNSYRIGNTSYFAWSN